MARLQILLLEDSPLDAELVSRRLEASGLEVDIQHVPTGKAFRAALDACDSFDLILSDYDLPDIDGMTALKLSRAKCPDAPFIFVSGKLGEEAAVQSLQEGATDYVVKHRLDRLMPAVRRALDERRERHQREAAERALRDAQSRLQASLEASEVATWLWDIVNDRVYGDRNLNAMFNLDGHHVEGSPLEVFLREMHPEDRPRVEAIVDQAIESDAERYEAEYRLVASDGSVRHMIARGRIERDENGRALRLAGIVLDISAQKRAEEERQKLLERERAARLQSEHYSRLKDEFLATLSHELRTPLNAILGWSQLVRRKVESNHDAARGLEIIERNARAQARLIEDLLDMSRILSGKVRLNLIRIEVAAVAQAAIDVVQPAADARRIEVRFHADPDIGPVLADPARIQQVIWNLLSNAVKFTPVGGSISVTVSRAGDHISIAVSDTGAGISSSFLPLVFERFLQADSSITRNVGGLGLGLSIVKHLVETHGGSVHAESDGEGKGSRFIVLLPRHAAAEPDVDVDSPLHHVERRPTRDTIASAQPLLGLSVLAVDDEPDARSMLKQILESNGATVATAGSAQEARSLLEHSTPHILVSDIGMPGEDGYQFIRTIRESERARGAPRRSAIALTAFARAADAERALNAGFDAHLPKPVDIDALILAVKEHAGRSLQ